MNETVKNAVDATWTALFGLSPVDIHQDSVHVLAAGDADDVVSVMVDRACVVRVPEDLAATAQDVFGSLTAEEAFAAGPLERLMQDRVQVIGLSWHHYGNRKSLHSRPDPRVTQVLGDDAALMSFLEANSVEDGPRAASRSLLGVMSSTG